jgi:hypothetical protein
MKRKKIAYLTVLSQYGWDGGRVIWNCQCICGKKLRIEDHRLTTKKGYKSCGCIRDASSLTYFYEHRKKLFKKISKQQGHWIFETKSTQKVPIIRAFNHYWSLPRLMYVLWNHLKDIPPGHIVDRICNNNKCVHPNHIRLLTHGEKMTLNHIQRKKKNDSTNK